MRRVGQHSVSSFKKKPVFAIGSLLLFLTVTLLLSWRNRKTIDDVEYEKEAEIYQLTNKWRFGIISDMDENSKVTPQEGDPYWRSYFRKATLIRDPASGEYTIAWDETSLELKNYLNEKGRALELSDLTRYNNRLYACDDRTGVIYEIIEGKEVKAVPRQILMDGDGNTNKGFKCEWGTVKDGFLFIGSFGKEYTGADGSIINENPLWVKVLDAKLTIKHVKWNKAYSALRAATDTLHPGYLFHESCQWNRALRRWFFLPRRLSRESYNPKLDEQKGANVLISLNEEFENPKVAYIGAIKEPSHGFSAFRFIPGREDEIIALKTEEIGLEKIGSYIMIFNTKGDILMDETQIATGVKYEGLEFLKDTTPI